LLAEPPVAVSARSPPELPGLEDWAA